MCIRDSYGTPVNVKEVYTEGITHITPLDIAYAKEFDCTIKLLGIAKLVGNEVEARVHPTMLPSSSPIAQVEGVYNAIQLVGDAVGDVVLYGRGAGSMPTGSAVVSDLMTIARNLLKERLVECRPPRSSRTSVVRFGCGRWKK